MDNNLKVNQEERQHQYIPCRNAFISDLAWIIQINKKSEKNFAVGSVATHDIITRERHLPGPVFTLPCDPHFRLPRSQYVRNTEGP